MVIVISNERFSVQFYYSEMSILNKDLSGLGHGSGGGQLLKIFFLDVTEIKMVWLFFFVFVFGPVLKSHLFKLVRYFTH